MFCILYFLKEKQLSSLCIPRQQFEFINWNDKIKIYFRNYNENTCIPLDITKVKFLLFKAHEYSLGNIYLCALCFNNSREEEKNKNY